LMTGRRDSQFSERTSDFVRAETQFVFCFEGEGKPSMHGTHVQSS
jgi:hypothetical protein